MRKDKNRFLEKKKQPMPDDRRFAVSKFQAKMISAVVVDHQLELISNDDDHEIFFSKVRDDNFENDDDENEPHEESRIYWESQGFLLQEILDQSNSTGSKLREEIKRNIGIARDSIICSCMDNDLQRVCIKCLRQSAVNQLCSQGFNALLCISKWKRTHKIPGGSHEYIEVIFCTQGRRKQVPFLVELGFRDEFRMANACDEYNKLIDQLPEIYIGKAEHLNAIIRLVCEAAKISAKQKNIHMGPWRKRDFMQMKWSASTERRFHNYSSNEIWVGSSRQEGVEAIRSSFQLPMASTVKVA